jgi:hypothetical protein
LFIRDIPFFGPKAWPSPRQERRDPSATLPALQVFDFAHLIIAKPLHIFARHALACP